MRHPKLLSASFPIWKALCAPLPPKDQDAGGEVASPTTSILIPGAPETREEHSKPT
ncbi:hypothetical protein KSD_45470 [Ktedonobacter sp. SOSP1-85]|uniref:hypothetical protein n=1 Tax=Ktedonobacter sp. SOSP1-85 TaxID=2778367 RepID=UPI0019163568|nr:hypothetical protein [Ktedonobacter sp. SOSP1-85]GHO76776.1 hypothetical protein KSD_45470 [Ktedonobacter sp. SOSP1-85]